MAVERGTRERPRVASVTVRIHPDQTLGLLFWKWGPRWDDGGRHGWWVIDELSHVAIRAEVDEQAPVRDPGHEMGRLLSDARDAEEIADRNAYLRGLDAPTPQRDLRTAVATGKVGGPNDGAPRRTRKSGTAPR